MIVYGLETHLDHFWEFAVFGRFCAIYVLEWNWPLIQLKILFGTYWEPNHAFGWSGSPFRPSLGVCRFRRFLCDLRIGVELAPYPA